MIVRLGLLLLGCAWLAVTPARAQSLNATQIYLGSQPCRLLTGSGSPEGAVTAQPCSVYFRTSDGQIWRKASGSGNTGWVQVSFTDPLGVTRGGTGAATFTSNALLYGNGTGALGALSPGASGTVLTGTGSTPAYSATPTVTSLSAGTLTGSTSVTTPTVTSGSGLTLSPVGDLTLSPAGADVLPGTSYAINLGSAVAKYLSAHIAELNVGTLIAADYMSTISGRVIVAPSTRLAADLTNVATSISVEHNNLANGDRVVLEAGGQVEWIAVTSGASGSGPYTYSITRNLDGSGANAWSAGDGVMNTGTTGDGFLDAYADSGILPGTTVGPTMVGNVRTGTTYSDVSPRWAIGNLNGLFGYGSDTYGAAFGTPTAAWLKIDPTNGVRIGHNSTTNVQLDASGNASFLGALTSSSGTIGGWTLGASSLTATNLGLYSGAANTARVEAGTGSNVSGVNSCNGSSDIGLWAGAAHASRASAPFRVTCGGVATMTGASITGPEILLTPSGASPINAGSVRFSRNGSGFGQSGDAYALYGISNGTTQQLSLTKEAVGNATSDGNALTSLGARGWDSPSTALGRAEVIVSSTIANGPLISFELNDSANDTVNMTPTGLNPGADNQLSLGTTGARYTIVHAAQIGSGSSTLTMATGSILPTDSTVSLGGSSNQFLNVYSDNYFAGTTQGVTDTCAVNTFTVTDGLVTACTSASDPRLKMNMRPAQVGLAAIRSLRPITFNYRPDAFPGMEPTQDVVTRSYTGFNAEELLAAIPDAVGDNGRGYLSIRDTMPILAALVNAVKELEAEIRALKAHAVR